MDEAREESVAPAPDVEPPPAGEAVVGEQPAGPPKRRRWRILAVLMIMLRVLGVFFAIDAVMSTRTAQGTIAWSVALVAMPVVAVPAYLVFGRDKFQGYIESRRDRQQEVNKVIAEFRETFLSAHVPVDDARVRGVETLVRGHRFTGGNEVELLVNGDETFDAILAGMVDAEEYLFVQFYIVHDDEIGRQLKDVMIDRARAGVRVYFLFDEVGSLGLPEEYKEELRQAGVEVSDFGTTQGRGNRFQINFRNHRKIVVVDGKVGFVGGLNIGDEYRGLDPEVGYWRDTHMRVEGPATVDLQRTFMADWYWATRQLPEVSWEPVPAASGADVLTVAIPSGPADQFETAGLLFADMIQSARERVWIATPYFVPDRAVVAALQLAGLRGVDVRVMVPYASDSRLVDLSAFSYVEHLAPAGIEFYRYTKGFMHHKVMLVDDDLSVVGTANMDNRSFRLNFEVTQIVLDKAFAAEMEAMFEDDFADAQPFELKEAEEKSFLFHLGVRLARLSAPIL